jgi:uncharacterized protein
MADDRKLAVVTGATAGIGAAFARRLAAEGYDVVLVARDAVRLAATAAELDAASAGTVRDLPADLSTDEGIAKVAEYLASEPVDLVVNNAGTSLNVAFVESTAADEERLLRLNVHAVLRLTLAVLPGMMARGRGDVVNVSSVAGFGVPMPGSTYSATKAWVNNFSESVAYSVRGAGVRVMAVCPGYTRTEFHQRAGINMSRTPAWMWLNADEVAREGLRDLRRGRVISVPNWKYKIAVWGMRHLPRRVLQAASRDVRGRTGRKAPGDRDRTSTQDAAAGHDAAAGPDAAAG